MLAAFSWLTDPEVSEVNKEKPHSDHTFYTKNGDLRQNLNGTWKFHYSEHPDSRPADFYRTDYDVTGFDSIQVPGHIQLQGYDKPQYVNTQYPWEGQEQLVLPQIPQKRNPVGSYVKCFDLDKALFGKDVYISLHRLNSLSHLLSGKKTTGLLLRSIATARQAGFRIRISGGFQGFFVTSICMQFPKSMCGI